MIVSQGKQKHPIHILVLSTFYGPCPPRKECCRHLNGDSTDNRWPENLEWGTQKENVDDKVRHGVHNKKERNGRAKLTQTDINNIRTRPYHYGIYSELAREYNISDTQIHRIRNKLQW
jgi:hypothetical protein